MHAQLNHTIVWCRDKQKSSGFLVDLLDLPVPIAFGPMLIVELDNGVSLDFCEQPGDISPQHYAFLIGEDGFDAAFARIGEWGLPYWADPGRTRPGESYRFNGGRGVYFDNPDGHLLELMTRPYFDGAPVDQ
ncbi:VOC family protein [Azoarcus sp. DN11]|uniref:VOC family protein n=1 Tax=Azoarcus sp. DN11 TaxID=356837 RepID=UPI000EB509F7|nr:VOC family protein [Azoarcus sp. DN11]AYH45615.1 bleomycin resistance protein [Azoarcus sp. DN11]